MASVQLGQHNRHWANDTLTLVCWLLHCLQVHRGHLLHACRRQADKPHKGVPVVMQVPRASASLCLLCRHHSFFLVLFGEGVAAVGC